MPAPPSSYLYTLRHILLALLTTILHWSGLNNWVAMPRMYGRALSYSCSLVVLICISSSWKWWPIYYRVSMVSTLEDTRFFFVHPYIGIIQVKEEGWTGFSGGWQGCSEGFPEGKARRKSQGAALPARGKTCPSRLFYLDLHSI